MPATRKTVLVAGATGLVGESALHRFADLDDWDAIDQLRSAVGRDATPALKDPGVALGDALA